MSSSETRKEGVRGSQVDITPASFTSDPKPTPRFQATTREWEELRKQKSGPCRICRRVPTTLHHLVSRSLRGSDVAENLVPLCGSGTHGCHGAVEARKPEAVSALRKNLRVEEVQYIISTKGSDWLYRYYPHVCEDCGEPIINFGAHYERCTGRLQQPPDLRRSEGER